jgi:phage tail-like protein
MARRAKRKPATRAQPKRAVAEPPAGLAPDAPMLTRNFRVTIDGVEIGFAAISQLASISAEMPVRGRMKLVHRYGNVVLRRALGRDRRLFAWRESIMAGKKDRRRVEIRQLDDNFEPVSSWILEAAWPCRWAGPLFDANETGIAMEEVELAFERLIWR